MNEMENLVDDRCPSHSSVLVNNCKGDKWIYKEEQSVFAVSYSYCVGGCGIFGKVISNEKIKRFLCNVFEDLKKRQINEFEFSCEEKDLAKQVLELFPEKTVHTEMEYSYRYEQDNTIDLSEDKEKDYTIIAINRILLDDVNSYDNCEMLLDRMNNSWEKEAFVKMSLGFVAVKDNKMIGIIFGSAKYLDYLAIDIEVGKEYRRKGIAEKLTKYFIEECQNKRLIAQWDCVESNIASQKLAEKTGFTLFKKRPYYWFDIN